HPGGVVVRREAELHGPGRTSATAQDLFSRWTLSGRWTASGGTLASDDFVTADGVGSIGSVRSVGGRRNLRAFVYFAGRRGAPLRREPGPWHRCAGIDGLADDRSAYVDRLRIGGHAAGCRL